MRWIYASGVMAAAGISPVSGKLLQGFEGDGFGDWKVEGDAFGLGPTTGSLQGLNGDLSAFSQESLACSAHGGDAAKGSLTSPRFKVTENYISFVIAGGNHPGKTAAQLLVDGKVAREATGKNSLQCHRETWEVSEFKGKEVQIRVIDDESGGWGMIAADHFVMTGNPNEKFPSVTRNGKPHLAGLVATNVIPGVTIPEGTKLSITGDYKTRGVTSPTALAFGENGEIYVTETHRFRHGVPDNRDHLYWYLDDIASRTTDDRRKMHEKWQDKDSKSSLKFLTEKDDMIRVLSKPDDHGISETSEIFARGFNDLLDGPAAGVFAYEGTVFLACIPNIWALRDNDGDGKIDKPDERKVLFDGFGVRVSFSGHDLNGFALGPDGRIYGTLGDRGMNYTTREGVHYELPDQGCVFRFDPDGTNFEVIHTGLRNPKEIAFDEFGNAFSVDNNSDQGDLARIVYIMEGADSGWNMGHQALHSFHRQIGIPEHPVNRWMAEKMWAPENDEQPSYILPPVANLTAGPSGLTYHPGTGFLESEAGRFLICDYRGGAANSGIWSFKVEPSGADMKLSDSRELNWGAAVTDVEYSWDGKLYVTDFIGGWGSHEDGRVYSIIADEPWRASEAEETAELIEEGFEKRPVPALERLLSHSDMRVRLRAELALTRKDGGFEVLSKAAKEGKDTLTRLHGLWGVGVIARRGSAALPGNSDEFTSLPAQSTREEALKVLRSLTIDEENAEIRAQAVKAIGDAGVQGDAYPFTHWLADESPRVRAFAAIAAGKTGALGAISAIWEMLEKNEDPALRHAGAYGLSLLSKPSQLAVLNQHEDPAVRLAGVIALRRLNSPMIAAFLHDEDPKVAREALRGIHDAGIEEARPRVADLLEELPEGLTEMDWRRLLHSAFRLGDAKNLQRVIGVAIDKKAPAAAREEALRLIGDWKEPNPVDQSLGHWSPLPSRDPDMIRGVLAKSLGDLLQLDGKLAEPALALVSKYEIDLSSVDDQALKTLVMSSSLPGAARSEALDLYAARKPAGLDDLLGQLANGSDDDLAISAIKRLAKNQPASALDALRSAVKGKSAHRQQQAWEIAAGIQAEGIASLFTGALAQLKQNSGVSPSALELLEASSKRSEPEVKAALEDFKKFIAASTDPLAPYLGSLEGGDPVKGGQLFESQPAAQCMRCHSAGGGHGGGQAGPNLIDVGKRGDAKFMLESLTHPGAKVAMGFGISSITLKGGKSVAGLVIEDNDDHVDLDANGKVLRVRKSDVESMSPPVSAMPPMGSIVSASELRDLVAWLSSQKGKTPDAPKRAEPELVEP